MQTFLFNGLTICLKIQRIAHFFRSAIRIIRIEHIPSLCLLQSGLTKQDPFSLCKVAGFYDSVHAFCSQEHWRAMDKCVDERGTCYISDEIM